MRLDEISGIVVDVAVNLHKQLGPGLLESVYERILSCELQQRGLQTRRQVPMPLIYQGIRFDLGFRLDLLIEDRLVIELKSAESIALVHKKQVLTYLRAGNFKLGLLLNFGATRMKDGIWRVVNNFHPSQ